MFGGVLWGISSHPGPWECSLFHSLSIRNCGSTSGLKCSQSCVVFCECHWTYLRSSGYDTDLEETTVHRGGIVCFHVWCSSLWCFGLSGKITCCWFGRPVLLLYSSAAFPSQKMSDVQSREACWGDSIGPLNCVECSKMSIRASESLFKN